MGKRSAYSETKYPFVVHAELNAILNARGKNLTGAKIYISLFPCNECAKAIIQAGIKEVLYLSDKYEESESTITSKRMLTASSVKFTRFVSHHKSFTIDLRAEK